MTSQEQPSTVCVCGHLQCLVPHGTCHCHCGKRTSIERGKSKKFISGHNNTRPRVDRIDAAPFKIDGVYCQLIQLTKGQWCLVEFHRFRELQKHLWRAKYFKSNRSFYAVTKIKIGGKLKEVQMHRMILGLSFGNPLKGDHINCCTLDNRDSNLREANSHDNARNQRKSRRNTSGFKGVTALKTSWRAQMEVNGKHISLGCYQTPEEAHLAYCSASAYYFGEFARAE